MFTLGEMLGSFFIGLSILLLPYNLLFHGSYDIHKGQRSSRVRRAYTNGRGARCLPLTEIPIVTFAKAN